MDSCKAKEGRDFPKGLAVVLCGVVIVVMLGALWFKAGQDEFSHKEKSAKIFIGQIIDSVRADTDFYRAKTDSDIVAKVETSRNLVSNDYTILTIDYSWDIYEGTILFSNETKIKIDVSFRENEPYMLTNWRQLE
jgi:hypothetical protein